MNRVIHLKFFAVDDQSIEILEPLQSSDDLLNFFLSGQIDPKCLQRIVAPSFRINQTLNDIILYANDTVLLDIELFQSFEDAAEGSRKLSY